MKTKIILFLAIFFAPALAFAYTISAPDGGDCSQIGNWYPSTKTCGSATTFV